MAANVERIKRDLDRLTRQGDLLENAMVDETNPTYFINQLGREKAEELRRSLPDFKTGYEAWYSESLAVVRQLLPDRVRDFIGLYENSKDHNDISYENYRIQDYTHNIIHVRNISGGVVNHPSIFPLYRQQLAILKAAHARFDSSLFEIRHLVQADLFDSEIDAARELLKNNFFRAAGAVVGVVLEKHLRQVCDDHSIKVAKKNPGIADLNDLLKANSVIDIPEWRHISLLGDIRNQCAHDKEKEPTAGRVTDLIEGTDKVLKTI